MKIHNPKFSEKLELEINNSLAILREQRGFSAEECLGKKIDLINRYFTDCKLSACVVAVSGGIDSAVTLGLVCTAAKKTGSPIKKIVAAMIPIFDPKATTNQEEALAKGKEVVSRFGLKPTVIDLTRSHGLMKNTVDDAVEVEGKPWAAGQLIAYLRTPALYYLTSLLSQEGYSAVLCGTTNRDEGAYLGYVGKASDGMVDLQLISDLHKSEVYEIAKILNVPGSIRKSVPTGDMFDGRVDEEVFGAPYDFVELFLLMKCLKSEKEKDSLQKKWSEKATEQFKKLSGNLEALHAYNAHKYLVGSPAVHLDFYESAVPGGWEEKRKIKGQSYGKK